ncbi:hypothetical protein [Paenibacillus aquistagni]|uniref:Uncharacterized protein n=1 Tax=Paenibacillus aquistagni TaxID=1852522 RepID=A0A1X7L5E5_9BACL|nr:hypothetical protein [Paenibacillus aquistagni]SMG48965.1 hypothetical protein SAMN06295960_2994 [Paenibacillus aquistagni]
MKNQNRNVLRLGIRKGRSRLDGRISAFNIKTAKQFSELPLSAPSLLSIIQHNRHDGQQTKRFSIGIDMEGAAMKKRNVL